MRLSALLMLLSLSAGPGLAVAPETWDHKAEADFAEGKFDLTAVSSIGEVRLARKVDVLMPAEDAPDVVSAVIKIGEHIYAGSGVQPLVYKISSGKSAVHAELPGAIVTSLAASSGKLLAATGGDGGGIYEISPDGKATKLWSDEAVKYVWAMAPAGEGKLFAATGCEGKVYLLTGLGEDVRAQVLYEAGKLAKNILCLALSAKSGMLYAGTDEEGLVIEINTVLKTSRVILDAEEAEIAAIRIDSVGGIFAATSEAALARGDGADKPNKAQAGKAVPSEDQGETKPDEDPDDKPAPDKADEKTQKEIFIQVDIDEMVELLDGNFDQAGDEDVEWRDVPAIEQEQGKAENDSPTPTSMPDDEQADGQDEQQDDEPEEKTDEPPAAPSVTTKAKRPAHKGRGNAVYYIAPSGLVDTRFRRPVTILDMLFARDRLYLATGNGGAVYSVSIDGDEVVKLVDTEAAQVTSLAAGRDGRIIFATANKGSVAAISGELAQTGSFTSEPLDAKQVARWGTVRLWAQMPPGTSASLATRSGNVKEPDEATWSSWSKDQPANGGFLSIGSPSARFLQYRLTLKGNGKVSPAAQHVRIIYQVGNLAPAVEAVTVTAKSKGAKNVTAGGARAFREIAIKAADPNGDGLIYQIKFAEAGTKCWVPLAEDLDKPKFIWDTRTVSDGNYQILVEASDSPANPPKTSLKARRISDLVLVDNTAPLIGELGASVANGKLTVYCAASDARSRIVEAHYSVDSQEEWTVLAACDGMYDSDKETFRFELTKLSPGPHRIAVKVADLYGNVAYKAVSVTVGK